MISETGSNVHDVCDFSQSGMAGSMKTVIHITDPSHHSRHVMTTTVQTSEKLEHVCVFVGTAAMWTGLPAWVQLSPSPTSHSMREPRTWTQPQLCPLSSVRSPPPLYPPTCCPKLPGEDRRSDGQPPDTNSTLDLSPCQCQFTLCSLRKVGSFQQEMIIHFKFSN